jgi:hypothetical protein
MAIALPSLPPYRRTAHSLRQPVTPNISMVSYYLS